MCRAKTTCPKCSGPHLFSDCLLNNDRTEALSLAPVLDRPSVKCCNCKGSHSAAFWGCPKFQERKRILEIKTLKKIPYGEAVILFNEENKALTRLVDVNDAIINVDSQEVFEVNSENPSSNLTLVKQSNLNQLPSFHSRQDSSGPNEGTKYFHTLNNPLNNSNSIAVSTPWKSKNSQVIRNRQLQGGLGTVQEEDYPSLPDTRRHDNKFLESLVDKYLSFMLNLFQDLLPTGNILARFNNFAASLTETEHRYGNVKNFRL